MYTQSTWASKEEQVDGNPARESSQYPSFGKTSGWAAMARAVREFDEEKVRDCKEDIDTLLVFVSDRNAV